MDTVTHDGRTTTYRVVEASGAGPTTLYVHGSGGSHQGWAHQYAPSGPAHPAAALDLSGHGQSEDVDGSRLDDVENTAILGAYARDVVAVANAIDADVLVGNSMGGAIVLQIALGESFNPAGIVLAGTGAHLPVDEKLRTLLAEDFEKAIQVLHGEDVLCHDADERTLSQSKATMRAAGQKVVQRDFLACHDFDVRDRLGEIDTSALAIVGEHDRLTPPEYHRTLTEELPDCRYAEIEDAAHLAMLEQPAAFNAALADFFDALE